MAGRWTTEVNMAKKKKKAPFSQRFAALNSQVDSNKLHTVDEAVGLVKKLATAKFPESVELALRLGIDPKKSDQNVRGERQISANPLEEAPVGFTLDQ